MLSLFVSDIHLHPSRPQTARRFGEFLAQARDARSLYILGDLFDAWAGDDDLSDPFNADICAALKALAAAGTQVFFLPGNRDFLVREAFAATTGVTIIPDESVVDISSTPTLLLHGDTLCSDDRAYLEFRAQVRSETWQRDFLARPLADRKAEIADLRARSEAGKREKPAELMDVNQDAVAQAYARHGVARIIHGHTHRRAHHRDAGGERWVLPDWDDQGGALACDASGCRWLDLP